MDTAPAGMSHGPASSKPAVGSVLTTLLNMGFKRKADASGEQISQAKQLREKAFAAVTCALCLSRTEDILSQLRCSTFVAIERALVLCSKQAALGHTQVFGHHFSHNVDMCAA